MDQPADAVSCSLDRSGQADLGHDIRVELALFVKFQRHHALPCTELTRSASGGIWAQTCWSMKAAVSLGNFVRIGSWRLFATSKSPRIYGKVAWIGRPTTVSASALVSPSSPTA